MSRLVPPAIVCVLLLLSVALAACGGGGSTTAGGPSAGGSIESTGTGAAETGPAKVNQSEPRPEADSSADVAAIEKAIVASVSGDDPADCTRVEAPGFLEQTTGVNGEAALRACEEEAESRVNEAPLETVSVGAVEAIGESATANATISGGSLDGQTVQIALRKEGGDWRLGRLIGFAHFNRTAFVAALAAAAGDQGGTAATTGCVEKGLAKVPTRELEDSVLVGAAPAVAAAFEACQ